MDPLTEWHERRREPTTGARAPPARRREGRPRRALRRRGRMIQIFLAVLALVAVATFVPPRMYETRARILVKYRSEYVYRPQVGEARLPIALAPEEILNSEMSILTSDELVREVIEELGVTRLYPGSLGRAPSLEEASRSSGRTSRPRA